ncbi:MAG: hypothetical protein OHK0038_04490 [Flammeovirgaceae bacterium]
MSNDLMEQLVLKHLYQESTPEESELMFELLQQNENKLEEFYQFIELQKQLNDVEIAPSEECIGKILQQSLIIEIELLEQQLPIML